MTREDFLTTLQERQVPSNTWVEELEKRRQQYGAFDDERTPTTTYTPAQVFLRRNEMEQQQSKPFQMAEPELAGLRDSLLNAEFNEILDPLTSDMIVREDMGLGDDDIIDDQTYLDIRQSEYNDLPDVLTPIDQLNNSISTPTRVASDGFRPEEQSLSVGVDNRITGVSDVFERGVTVPVELALLGKYKYIEGQKERLKNKNFKTDALGRKMSGSFSAFDHYVLGDIQAFDTQNIARLFTSQALNKDGFDREVIQKALNDRIDFTKRIGVEASTEGQNILHRILDDSLQTAAPLIESQLLATGAGIATTALTASTVAGAPAAPAVGIATRNIVSDTYWQQQGAGSILFEIYKDKDLSKVSQEEFKKSVAIAQAIGVPYALVERLSKPFGFIDRYGRTFQTRLANAMFKRALTDPNFGRKAARLATGYALGVFQEGTEEGIQGFLQELGIQLGDKEQEVNVKKMFNEAYQSTLDARYAVLGLGMGSFVGDTISLNREIKQVDARRNAMKKAGYSAEEAETFALGEAGALFSAKKRRKSLIAVDASSLINRGVTEDIAIAEELAERRANAKQSFDKDEANIAILTEQLYTHQKTVTEGLGQNQTLGGMLEQDADISRNEIKIVARKIYNSSEETGERIANAYFKRVKINAMTEKMISQGTPREMAHKAASQLSRAKDQEEINSILQGLREEFDTLKIKYDETNSYLYNKLGAITPTEFRRLAKQSPEIIESIIKSNLMDEDVAQIFRRAINGDKQAQKDYNVKVEEKRSEKFKQFISENKLQSFMAQDTDMPQKTLPEIRSQQILSGLYDTRVKAFQKKYGLEDLSIEEARSSYEATIKRLYEINIQKEKDLNSYENVDKQRKQEIRSMRKRVLSAISEVSPNTKIILHKSTKAFATATGDANANGYFIESTGTIHIDESKAQVGLIAHEAFHNLASVVMSKGDFEVRSKEVFKQILPNLKPQLRKEVESHLYANERTGYEGYEGETYFYEEGLAKTLELLSTEYHNLNQQDKTAIRQLIDAVMEFLGLGEYSNQIYNFGVELDVNNLSRRELQYRAKLLGIEGRNVSTTELRKKIGTAVSKQEIQTINAMQNLAIKMHDGITIDNKDLDFIRPDFHNQTRNQLSQRAKQLGLKSSGTKKEIIKRIRDEHPDLRASKHVINDPNFIKDFEGSAVVDDNGNPLMVLHGTNQTYADYNIRLTDGAIFFTNDKSVASFYANHVEYMPMRKVTPRIYPAYIKMKTPLRLDFEYKHGLANVLRGKQLLIKAIKSQYPTLTLPRNAETLNGFDFIDMVRGLGIDGIISPIVAKPSSSKQYVTFDIDNVVPAYTIPTYGRVRAAKRVPRTKEDVALEIYEDEINALEAEYNIDLGLPAPLVSNRVEREERAIRDFDILSDQLPDDIRYSVGNVDGEAVVYMDIPNPDKDTIDAVKEVADKTHVKIISGDQHDGFIEIDGAFEYRPVRGRHIETLKISELRTLAKDLGVSTTGVDLDFLEKMETMFRAGGKISPVTYQKSLTADVTNEEIVNEIDQSALRPEERAAVQREGVVPEVGRENYRSTVATNRRKFLYTRQELINRLRKEGKLPEFLPRIVKGRRASKDRTPAEIDSIIDQIIDEMKANTKKPKTKAEIRSSTKREFRGRMAERLKKLAELKDVVLRDIEKVEEYTNRNRNIQQFIVGKRPLDGATINAVVVGNKIYYFAKVKQTYLGQNQDIYYRVDENGNELMPSGEEVRFSALLPDDTRIEQTMIGYTANDAAMYMYLQSLESFGKRPTKQERFKDPNREKQRELNQDDFGLSSFTKAELISLGMDDRVNAFEGLGKKLGIVGKATQDILADMSDTEIARMVKRGLNALRKEAIQYQEEREVYRNTLREDYNIDPDGEKGRELSFEEMRRMHESKVEEENKEFEEPEIGDVDDFLEFMQGIEEEQQTRKEEDTVSGALTKKQIDRTYKAYTEAEPDKFEQQKFAPTLFQASTEYNEQSVESLIVDIIASPSIGVSFKQLISIKLRITELEDRIESATEKINDQYSMVSVGAGSNVANIERMQEAVRADQKRLSDALRAARLVSNQWGKVGVALRMSRTEKMEFRLGDILNTAYEAYNQNRKEGYKELPQEILNDLNEKVKFLRDVDKKLDDVTKRRVEAEAVWDNNEAVKWIYSSVKGGRWIATATEKYIPKDEIANLKTKEQKLQFIYNELLKRIQSFGYEVTTNFSVNNRASKNRDQLSEYYETVIDLVKTGIALYNFKNIEDVVPFIQESIPDLSEVEIIRVISNRGETAQKALLSEEQQTLNRLKGLARTFDNLERALARIEEVKVQRNPQDADVVNIRKVLQQYQVLIKAHITDDNMREQVLLALDKIDDNVALIIDTNVTMEDKADLVEQTKQKLVDINKQVRVSEEISNIESIMNDKDRDRALSRWEAVYGVLTKKEKTPQSAELKSLIITRRKKESELRRYIFNLKLKDAKLRTKVGTYALEVAGVPRQLLATFDFSYFVRQGLMGLFMNPKIAGSAYIEAFKALKESNAALIDVAMRTDPMYAEMAQLGLDLSAYDGRMNSKEEVFANNLVNRIPYLGGATRASERHMVTGLNVLRFQLMKQFLESETGKNASMQAREAFANYINTMSGRPSLGKAEPLAQGLSQVFFSPRFAYSRVILAPQAIKTAVQNPELRMILLKQWLSFITTGNLVMALSLLAIPDEDDVEEYLREYLNPYSPRFGLVRIGNMHFDVFGGAMQPFRTGSRILLQAFRATDADWIEDIQVGREIFKFAGSKSSPQLRMAYEAITGEDIRYGGKVDFSDPEVLKDFFNIAPLSLQGLAENIKEVVADEMSVGLAAASFAAEFHGIGANLWSEDHWMNKQENKVRKIMYY
tara:strand:+ start:4926 stop:13505 length:8580 start_codon:yes stop_codon:yes gene_type:complete